MVTLTLLLLLAPVEQAPAGTPPAQICKKIERIGSLARGRKKCMTAAEWDEFTRTNKDYVASMQGQNWGAGSEGAREAQLANPMTNGAPF